MSALFDGRPEWWVETQSDGEATIKFKDGRGRLRWWPVNYHKAATYRLGSIAYFRALLAAMAKGTSGND